MPGRALSAARLLRSNGRGDVDRATLAFRNRRDGLSCRSLHGIISMAVFETLSMEEDPVVSKPGTTVIAPGEWGPRQLSEGTRRAIGWFCSYTPIELVVAAGANPVRVFADEAATARADRYFPPNLCPYARACLAWGLERARASLAGVVLVHSCNAMSQLASAWRRYVPVPVIAEVDVPRGDDEASVGYMVSNMRRILAGLKDLTGRTIDVPTLDAAISTVEGVRQRWRSILAFQAVAVPGLRGAALSALAKKVLSQGPEEACRTMDGVISRRVSRPGPAQGALLPSPRVLLVGSVIPDAVLQAVDAAGADVIYDESCSGGRCFTVRAVSGTPQPPAAENPRPWRHGSGNYHGDSPPKGYEGIGAGRPARLAPDPAAAFPSGDSLDSLLTGLARAYLARTPCARMKSSAARVQRIVALANSYRAEGVISCTLKFCDPYLYEQPLLRAGLERAGLPFLSVATEYGRQLEGRTLTRIEAFLEVILARRASNNSLPLRHGRKP